MKKQAIAVTIIIVLIAQVLIACADGAITNPDIQTSVALTTFTDSVGRVVELPANLTRVSPSGITAQMYLIAIAPDMLCTVFREPGELERQYLPSQLSGLPAIGSFYGSADLNFESVAAIAPELVIDIGELKDTITEDMDSITAMLAIPAVHITAEFRDAPEVFRTLGVLLGREAKGEELAAFCEMILAQTDDIMTEASSDLRNILWVVGDAGLNVIAQGSFQSEVLDMIADNAAVLDNPSPRGAGNETDMEQIMLWNPDTILFDPTSRGVYDRIMGSLADGIYTEPVWGQLDAVNGGSPRNGIYMIPDIPHSWTSNPPAVNRFLGVIWLTDLLYPEIARHDARAQVIEYYRLFYGYTLSEAEYDDMVKDSY